MELRSPRAACSSAILISGATRQLYTSLLAMHHTVVQAQDLVNDRAAAFGSSMHGRRLLAHGVDQIIERDVVVYQVQTETGFDDRMIRRFRTQITGRELQ